jgi:nitrate reductase delta subunit
MTATASAFEVIARLLEYPVPSYPERLAEIAALSAVIDGQAANLLADFRRAVQDRSLTELEELYTQTFDLNPNASLDIGWHLFGEDYARGEFLVKLRHEMRRYGVADRDELPDSLLSVLPLMVRMPEEEAAQLRTRFILPAVEKIRGAVPPEQNPFAYLLAALALLLSPSMVEKEDR